MKRSFEPKKYFLIKKEWVTFVMTLSVMAVLLFGFILNSNAQLTENCFTKNVNLHKLLPEIVGELKKDANSQIYTHKNLYDYMDGGAEYYLNSGLVCLFVQEYQKDQQILNLEIYHFKDSVQTRKVYGEESAVNKLDIGEQGSYEECYTVYYLNNFLVKGMCFNMDSSDPLLQLSKDVERILVKTVEGRLKSNHTKEGYKHSETLNENRIVLIGASYAKGWDIKEANGITIINKGVSGEQSFEMLVRFNQDVISQKPRAVIIWGFINDIFRSKREEISLAIERAEKSFMEMVKLSQENGIIPILATEVTIRPKVGFKETLTGWVGWLMGKKSYQDYINQQVLDMNQWLRDYAKANNLQILDLQPVISDKHGKRLKEYATNDGSHISKKGYERLTLYIRGILAGYLREHND